MTDIIKNYNLGGGIWKNGADDDIFLGKQFINYGVLNSNSYHQWSPENPHLVNHRRF